MTKICVLAFLIACSSSPKEKSEAISPSRTHQFTTVKESQNFLTNKSRYLKLLFEQSHDPYYNTPKWSEACLQRNKVGDVKVNPGEVSLLSRLVLNPQGEPGHCEGTDTDLLYVQCGESPVVAEYRCPAGQCPSLISGPCQKNK